MVWTKHKHNIDIQPGFQSLTPALGSVGAAEDSSTGGWIFHHVTWGGHSLSDLQQPWLDLTKRILPGYGDVTSTLHDLTIWAKLDNFDQMSQYFLIHFAMLTISQDFVFVSHRILKI